MKLNVEDFLFSQHVSAEEFTKGYSVYRQTLFNGDKLVSEEYGITQKNPFVSVVPFSKMEQPSIGRNLLYAVRRNFVEQYAKTGFGLDGYDELKKQLLSPKELFEAIENGEDASHFTMVQYDYRSEKFYSKDGKWLDHYERYNGDCYHITNDKYDLQKVLDYLHTRDDVAIASNGIADIPHYNASTHNAKYINLYVKITNKDCPEKLDFSIFGHIPESILPLEQFKVDKTPENEIGDLDEDER